MNREQVTRNDFPAEGGGYDRASVDAHLAAVAAWTVALEAQIAALEVEREALRRAPRGDAASQDDEPTDVEPAREARAPDQASGPRDDEVSARLVATRLALDGVEREQIREKLEQDYDLEDSDSLLDDVLERLA